MCLLVNIFRHLNCKPKKARKNIKCYKILSVIRDNYGELTLRTPHRNNYITDTIITEGLKSDYLSDMNVISGTVSHGIHTYKTYETARINTFRDSIIIACYIPKGAYYWIGKYGDYCSTIIKFN